MGTALMVPRLIAFILEIYKSSYLVVKLID